MSEQASGGTIAMRAVGIMSLAIVLFFPWSFGPARAQSEPPTTVTCKGEWSTIKSWLPPGARIELLVAAGNTIPSNPVKLWPSYREAALSIFACAGEGAAIELLPITDNGASVAPLFVTTAPTPSPNQVRERLERDQFVNHSSAAVESLNATTTKFGGFDPLGALQLAGESLHHGAAGGKLIIVMIGNGWQQSDRINLFRWGDNPANHADDVIRQLKANRTLPNLAGIDIVIAGLTRGDPKLKMGPTEFMGLRTFWEKIIAASHGHLVWNQAYLPGMTAPLQSP